MSDPSERLHLEGLDEATERERWEEATAPARDDAEKPTRWIDSDYAKGFSDGAEEALMSAADDLDAQDARAIRFEEWLRARATQYANARAAHMAAPDELTALVTELAAAVAPRETKD